MLGIRLEPEWRGSGAAGQNHWPELATDDPTRLGKRLSGDKGDLWRYRIGDYRATCRIQTERLTVLVLDVGHRREVYRR